MLDWVNYCAYCGEETNQDEGIIFQEGGIPHVVCSIECLDASATIEHPEYKRLKLHSTIQGFIEWLETYNLIAPKRFTSKNNLRTIKLGPVRHDEREHRISYYVELPPDSFIAAEQLEFGFYYEIRSGKLLHIWPSLYKLVYFYRNKESLFYAVYKSYMDDLIQTLAEDRLITQQLDTAVPTPNDSPISEELKYRSDLLQCLKQYFNDEEDLKTLYFELGWKYSQFESGGMEAQARALVEKCFDTGRQDELAALMAQLRPNVEIPKPPG